jgi:hypothetical protein
MVNIAFANRWQPSYENVLQPWRDPAAQCEVATQCPAAAPRRWGHPAAALVFLPPWNSAVVRICTDASHLSMQQLQRCDARSLCTPDRKEVARKMQRKNVHQQDLQIILIAQKWQNTISK